METAAWVGAAVSVAVALLSGVFALLSRRSEQSARRSQLESKDAADRRRFLESSVKPTTDGLVYAADDLRQRLYNIINRGFLETYRMQGTDAQQLNASRYTLFLFAQVFGWIEATRRGVLYNELGAIRHADGTSARTLVDRVERSLASDSSSWRKQYAIFAGDQRAVGELMIEWTSAPPSAREPLVMRYARFSRAVDADDQLTRWLEPVAELIDGYPDRGAITRLTNCYAALVLLVEALDPNGVTVPQGNRTGLARTDSSSGV